MGRQVRGISHGVALPAAIDELSGKERRNAVERWNVARRRSTQLYRCSRCGVELPYTAFPQIRIFMRSSSNTYARRGVICTACDHAAQPHWEPRWGKLTPAERQQAEVVRAWVAAAWGEQPPWLNVGRTPDTAEARAVVGAILMHCYLWPSTRAGHALGLDHSTMLYHLGKLDAGDAPGVAEILADYQREHRARKAG